MSTRKNRAARRPSRHPGRAWSSSEESSSGEEESGAGEESGPSGSSGTVYADANATTLMSPATIETMVRWCNRGNPSSEYASAKEVQRMFARFRGEIATALGFELGPVSDPGAYSVVFTSGASESNCAVLVGVARSYATLTGRVPHIIIGGTEHKSSRACAERLVVDGLATLTVVAPATSGPAYGAIEPAAVAAALAARPHDTCLVSVMAANNETGAVTDVAGIAEVCAAARVPYHTDAVQVVGKTTLGIATGAGAGAGATVAGLRLAALSASAHKFHGPPGVGLLVLRNSLVSGYQLCPHICGSQNGGMRGGTENVPGIAAAFAAFRAAYVGLPKRAATLSTRRDALWRGLAAALPAFHAAACPGDPAAPALPGVAAPPAPSRGTAEARTAIAAAAAGGPPVLFRIGAASSRTLPNTLLLSVSRPKFCNRAARAALEARGIIVGLGSACNGGGAGDGLRALGLPSTLIPGVIRISLDSDATRADVDRIVAAFIAVVTGPDCLMSGGDGKKK